ncbi:hypothetical protein T12_480 [Trichinella patagoniensis]|uniref:Uncharacterized protein n=1 Tax=Trichinella patagoniensis TaxID=990121 RepID=A0A0V1A270_9BILA|nr:hypothetical protein T12_480 [Trichinella patagoniensis]
MSLVDCHHLSGHLFMRKINLFKLIKVYTFCGKCITKIYGFTKTINKVLLHRDFDFFNTDITESRMPEFQHIAFAYGDNADFDNLPEC